MSMVPESGTGRNVTAARPHAAKRLPFSHRRALHAEGSNTMVSHESQESRDVPTLLTLAFSER